LKVDFVVVLHFRYQMAIPMIKSPPVKAPITGPATHAIDVCAFVIGMEVDVSSLSVCDGSFAAVVVVGVERRSTPPVTLSLAVIMAEAGIVSFIV
jgi:hypothetical protein